jgi:flagellar basal body-associated protein FliL
MPDMEQKKSKDSFRVRRGRLPFAFPIVMLTAIGAGFWASCGNESASKAEGHVKSTLHLETFVLNLADQDQRSYLRVGIDLGLSEELKHGEQVPVAQVRDTILGVLAEGKVNDLLTPAGKTKLKENLLQSLQRREPELGVEEVYFTEFLIQR